MRLEHKVALITGAGSGIGRATAILFATEGAKVVVADIDPNAGQETVRMIREKKGDATFLEADVSKAEDVRNVIEKTVERYGRLDVLFNNAGIGSQGTVVDLAEEEWDRTINVNLKGVFLGCKYAIPYMIDQGGGSIINTASVNGVFAYPNEVAYDTSKGGVIQLTKSTALDFGSKNIRVNCICPGIVDTPLLHNSLKTGDYEENLKMAAKMNAAFQRLIKPGEVANVALFLASDESSAVTGSAYFVDAAYSAV